MAGPGEPTAGDERFLQRAVEATIRIGVLAALVAWCFQIVRPFVMPMAWGVIIAVAVHPAHRRLRAALGGRGRSAAGLLVLVGLAVLLVPVGLLGGTVVEGSQGLMTAAREGRLGIPELPASIAGIPVVGGRIAAFWANAAQNFEALLQRFEPQIVAAGRWVLSSVAGAGVTLLLSLVAILIAGVLLATDQSGARVARAVAARVAGDRGEEFAQLAGVTVQAVAQGILGVALIQSFLAGLGFLVVGVPGAGLWALVGLLSCVIQIGLLPVVLPIVVWAFVSLDTTTAVLFTIWSVAVSLVDNVLKPLLLGRGVRVPTAVIFVGAIGGFLSSGIIGLFVGAVVLVLGYTLFLAWLGLGPGAQAEADAAR